MIKDFKHKGLQKFFSTGSKAGIQAAHSKNTKITIEVVEMAERLLAAQ